MREATVHRPSCKLHLLPAALPPEHQELQGQHPWSSQAAETCLWSAELLIPTPAADAASLCMQRVCQHLYMLAQHVCLSGAPGLHTARLWTCATAVHPECKSPACVVTNSPVYSEHSVRVICRNEHPDLGREANTRNPFHVMPHGRPCTLLWYIDSLPSRLILVACPAASALGRPPSVELRLAAILQIS